MFESLSQESLVAKYRHEVEYYSQSLVDAKLTYQVNPTDDNKWTVDYRFRKYNEAVGKLSLVQNEFNKLKSAEKENPILEWALS